MGSIIVVASNKVCQNAKGKCYSTRYIGKINSVKSLQYLRPVHCKLSKQKIVQHKQSQNLNNASQSKASQNRTSQSKTSQIIDIQDWKYNPYAPVL
jgi:hypothetical protein